MHRTSLAVTPAAYAPVAPALTLAADTLSLGAATASRVDVLEWQGPHLFPSEGVEPLIHLVKERATAEQMSEMLKQLENYVKLAVDVRRGVLAGGGALHADCEAVLLEDGSAQADVWGADWIPATQEVTYESLINLRPGQGNLAMEVQSPELRAQIAEVVERLLGGI